MEFYTTSQPMTQISARQWDYVTQENLSAGEAVSFLMNGMKVRSFPEILKLSSQREIPEAELLQGLKALDPESKPDSVRRKVRNWYAGKSLPGEREEAFRICFALGLELDQADRLMNLLTDQGIHYRNPAEMAYAYCLRNHLGYSYALPLASQLSELGRGSQSGQSSSAPVTQLCRRAFAHVQVEEDLFDFILRNRANLGTFHNTAYEYFCRMLDLLTGESLEGEARYSMEYVADTYLRLNVPLDKKSGSYSDIQKLVKKYWPGARSIKAMKARTEDVTRKTLLLMYLVTGGCWEEGYDELDESYITPREFLETHCRRMNGMLQKCGMRRIDPRAVFDYLVLYCLRPEEDAFMSDRMAQLAAEIFSSEE